MTSESPFTAIVTGVHLKTGQSIAADLVVDASGGNSRINKWLEQIDHPMPPSMVVDAGLQYTCRMYDMHGNSKSNTDVLMIMDHPQFDKFGVRLPIEQNKWQVSQLLCMQSTYNTTKQTCMTHYIHTVWRRTPPLNVLAESERRLLL